MNTESRGTPPGELRDWLRKGSLAMDFSDVEGEVDDTVLGRRAFEITDHIVQSAGLSESEIDTLHMPILEILINAVKHGTMRDPKKQVQILYAASPQKFVLSVSDPGSGFATEDVPNPLADENLREMKKSGRGMLLAKKYFDTVTVSSFPSGGCEVRLEKNRDQSLPV